MAVSLEKRPRIAAAAPDLISDQPDAVLETIVSLLPTKDGCRTQALSRRWHSIWRSAPLNLDTGLGEQTISDIISGHLGPVRRICITNILPARYRYQRRATARGREIVHARFRRWLSSKNVLASILVLHLGYQVLDHGCLYSLSSALNVLPSSMFHLAPALHEATFAHCSLPAKNLTVNFPSLVKLSLYWVTVKEEALSAVLAGCPALRSLLLEETVGCYGCNRLRISSPSLRSIGFSAPWNKLHMDSRIVQVQELVIDDAPCLERLLLYDGPAIIRAVRTPKLEILGCVGKDTYELHLGTTIFQEMIAASLSTTMPTVTVLALDHISPDLHVVLNFLKCFPRLEKLYIVLDPHPPSENEVCRPKSIRTMRKHVLPNDPIDCLKFHLKKVALKFYCSRHLDFDFAKFFVFNARVLERMEVGFVIDRKDKWWDNHNMHQLLQLEDRASRDARFEFKKSTWTTFTGINKRTHDLSTDPFNA